MKIITEKFTREYDITLSILPIIGFVFGRTYKSKIVNEIKEYSLALPFLIITLNIKKSKNFKAYK
jgi:hypothetical protein